MACLDPQWAGGRPRLTSPDDEEFIATTATTRPTKLGQPFTRWSIRKLLDYPHRLPGRAITIGREALRTLLARHGITFQRTKTWKDSPDPNFEAKLERIEYALAQRPDRAFAVDEFGLLGIRPTAGSGWAPQAGPAGGHLPPHPRRHPLHGCYSVGDDLLRGVNRARKGIDHTWAALKSIRAARPDGAPTYASWANPVEAHFGPLRRFALANSDHPNHTVRTRALHAYLRWRNAHARHPDVPAAQRRERARIRGEKGVRWGGRPLATAA
ncbi:hypothetical protein SAMN05660976_06314 [Nonomuraea pusilla]|uniref:Transposase n=1 Tax=Nonomuraea pusilla TaxID=46177 RepID=A0A1H8C8Q4_9ACTN|nr:hypothetical protein SAMN05660976_06314 [Nonomuraea pusilla]